MTTGAASPQKAAQREVVVIGASAGGVEALLKTIGGLPPELPAAVFVVLHMAPMRASVLPDILARASNLPVTAALDGERFDRGHVYVAPPDAHMLLHDGLIRLTRGPRENGHRPAIDPLFRSAARAYDGRTVGVILSGMLDDGTAGLRFLKKHGGCTVVQDPEDALYPGMPESAIANVAVDRVAAAADIPDAISAMLDRPLDTPSSGPQPYPALGEPDLIELPPDENDVREGDPTALSCPECGGVLHQTDDGLLPRFACRVGHVYSPESLAHSQSEALEGALWAALRTLEERADVLRRMARRAASDSRRVRLEDRAVQVERDARVVHGVAARLGRATPDTATTHEAPT